MSTINLATLLVLLKLDQKQFDSGVEGSKKKTLDLKDAIAGGLVAAIGLATKAAVQFANESLAEFQTFEKGIKEVYTLLPGASEEALGAMRDDVIEFSKDVGRTTDETVPALYQAISAGVPPDNVFDFMKVASDAALGGVTDLETAVDGISSAVNAYGAETLNAQAASDLMFTAVKGGKTTFEELSASLFNVIPTAAALGVEFSNVTAALASMTAQGVPTSVATTQLRQLLVELSKEGSDAADVFEELAGVGFREFIAQGGNLQDALQIMEQGAADLGLGINDLFGSVEAGSAALSLTGEGAAKFTQELNNAAEAAGATAEAAEVMAGSLEHLEAVSTATTEALKIQTGEAIEPAKRQWLELKIAVGEYFNADLELRNQLLSSSAALEEYGYSGESLRKALGALGQGTTLWRNSLADADTMARRTEIAVGLLENGFQGSADALGDAVLRIEEADNASNDYVNTLDDLNQMAREQAAAQEEANRAHEEWINMGGGAVSAATDYSMSLEELARMGRDAANIQREELAVAQEEAAEAAKEAEEATRALNRESGSLFSTLSESEGPLGIYYQSLEDIANGASNLVVNQDSLDSAMIRAAENAGASASAMALLKVATGELSAEQAEAVIKQVALEQTLARLAEQYAAGDATLGEYMAAAQEAVRDINAMSVEFDTTTGAVNTNNQAIGSLIGTMGEIPTEIRTHISITSDPIPNMPGGSGGPSTLPGSGNDQAFALGGFTGGMENEIAGVVHGQEYVFSAPAVRSIGLPMLEMLHQQGMAAGGNSGVSIGDVYVTPGGADTPIEYGRAVRRDLLTVARGKGLRR